jgi:DNA-binding MarR family transcriptional regulator
MKHEPRKESSVNPSDPRAAAAADLRLVQALGEARIGLEARTHADDHIDVKIWLRLLACSTQIEQSIRQRLRNRFGTSLPRFDYLAQLDRHPDGLRMNVLSRFLMVTGGNVTGLTDQLVAEGLVERFDDPEDRRSCRVRLTPRGREDFGRMAAEHERWLQELFEGLAPGAKDTLYDLLGHLRLHLARRADEPEADAPARTPTRPATRKSAP